MKWVHYSGAGNTFFLADTRKIAFNVSQMRDLCKKGDVDGVILAEEAHDADADARMRIFNADGSEAEMCGNGLRCFIHFLMEAGLKKHLYAIETLAGKHTAWLEGDEVCVKMTPPRHLNMHFIKDLHFINTGVPHVVIMVPDIEKVDVALEGKKWRLSPLFAPAGTNVNFVSLCQDRTLAIRTYERGVEAETKACGTGAAASALIAHKLYHLPSPIKVEVRSGETLKISFSPDFSEVTLQGPVERGFELKDESFIIAPL
jgi:diaminopimelate epimerase